MAGSAPRKKDAKEKLQKDDSRQPTADSRQPLQACKQLVLEQGHEQRSQGRDLALEDGAGAGEAETALVPHSALLRGCVLRASA